MVGRDDRLGRVSGWRDWGQGTWHWGVWCGEQHLCDPPVGTALWPSLHRVQPPKDEGPPLSLGSTHPGAALAWWGRLG